MEEGAMTEHDMGPVGDSIQAGIQCHHANHMAKGMLELAALPDGAMAILAV